MRLNYTKAEVTDLKDKLYFTEQEEKILEYWILDYSIVMIADELNISVSTVVRRKKSIRDKINKLKTP